MNHTGVKVPEWIIKIHIYFQVTVWSVPALHAHPEGAGVTPAGGESKDGKHLEKREVYIYACFYPKRLIKHLYTYENIQNIYKYSIYTFQRRFCSIIYSVIAVYIQLVHLFSLALL